MTSLYEYLRPEADAAGAYRCIAVRVRKYEPAVVA